jgi:cysteinyl-tRNA synthetase
MDDDFNTASAIATLFELVRAINTAREAGVTGPFYEAAQATLRELGGVLGLTFEVSAAEPSNDISAKPFVDLLVEVRSEMRALKQWAVADRIRDRLKELGVVLEDTPAGTQWRFGE